MAQGLGGLQSVLDVKLKTFAAHATLFPVGFFPDCAATKHVHFTPDGSSLVRFTALKLTDWLNLPYDPVAKCAGSIWIVYQPKE